MQNECSSGRNNTAKFTLVKQFPELCAHDSWCHSSIELLKQLAHIPVFASQSGLFRGWALCNEIHRIPDIFQTSQSAPTSVFHLTTTVTHSFVRKTFSRVALGQVLHSYPKLVAHVPMGERLVEGSALQPLRTRTQSKCGTVKFAVTNLVEGNARSITHKNRTNAPLELLPRFSGELAVGKYIRMLTQITAPRF